MSYTYTPGPFARTSRIRAEEVKKDLPEMEPETIDHLCRYFIIGDLGRFREQLTYHSRKSLLRHGISAKGIDQIMEAFDLPNLREKTPRPPRLKTAKLPLPPRGPKKNFLGRSGYLYQVNFTPEGKVARVMVRFDNRSNRRVLWPLRPDLPKHLRPRMTIQEALEDLGVSEAFLTTRHVFLKVVRT